MRKNIKIITFRLDDITSTMDWEKFEKLDKIFTEAGIFPLLGIVPDNHDSKLNKMEAKVDFWEYMLQLKEKGYTLCQHGYRHLYTSKDSGLLGINAYSEFAGESLEEQKRRLQKGKKILESHGIDTDIFMAPAHSFDKNTLKALKENGFTKLTDGYMNVPYEFCGLAFYPSTISGPRKGMDVDTICLHPNNMSDEAIENIGKYIKSNKKLVKSYQTMLESVPVKKYSVFVGLTVRKNLWIREFKDFAANNDTMAKFMQETNDSSSYKKWLKRMVKSPVVLIAFFKRKK